MAREQAAEPLLVTILVQAHEGLLQRDGTLRVVACFRHIAHAVSVGFELGAAPVFHHRELRRDAGAADGEVAVVAVARCDCSADDHALHQHAARHLLRRVPRRRVHDLVAEHGRELGLGIDLCQQAAVDCDLATRQRPGVWDGIVEHREFIGQRRVADRRESITDRLHVGRQCQIDSVGTALRLLHRRVVLCAHRDFLLTRDEDEVALARHGIDSAARERDQECGDG